MRGCVKELVLGKRVSLGPAQCNVSYRLLRPSYAQIVDYGIYWNEGESALKGFLVLNFLGETQNLHCK